VLLRADVEDAVIVSLAMIDADVLSEDGMLDALLSVVFDEKLVNEAEPVTVKEEINWEVDRMEAEKLKESELESEEVMEATFGLDESDDTFCMELRLSRVNDVVPSALETVDGAVSELRLLALKVLVNDAVVKADELANELGVATAEEVEFEVAGSVVRLVKEVKLTAAEELGLDVADIAVVFVNGADASEEKLLVLANAEGDVEFMASEVPSEVIKFVSDAVV
jgi:hypothetical protein